MVSTLIILAVVAAALAGVWFLLFHTGCRGPFTARDWDEKKHDVDVEIFRSLLNLDDERYLASSLSRDEFAAFHRKRTSLALKMVRMANENAGMLMRLGSLAAAAEDAALAEEGDQLVAAATQFRLNLLLAQFCLWLKWIFPRWSVSVPAVEMRYQHLLDSLVRVQQHSLQS
jgi:hypothetical protein